MGLLDRTVEREITIRDLTRLGFRLRPHFGGDMIYWFNGGGSSYVKVKTTYNQDHKETVESLTYCSSDDGSRYMIKSMTNPTLDELEIVTNVVKNNKWR